MMLVRTGAILALISALSIAGGSAYAQSTDQTDSRLRRLENEIQTLSRAIYRGEMPTMPVQSATRSSDKFIGLSQRLTQLENEVRRMIGELERQGYSLRQLETKLNDISSMAPANAPAQVTAPEPYIQMEPAQEITSTYTPHHQPQPAANPHQLGTLVQSGDGSVQSATINGSDMEASRLYDQAFASLQKGLYEQAEQSFYDFLSQYKSSPLAANAQYWLAETQFIRKDYDGAARNFAAGYQDYPNSPKAPDNLLKLGLSLSALGQEQEACVTFVELFNKYPQAPRNLIDQAIQENKKLGCS